MISPAPSRALRGGKHAGKGGCALLGVLLEHGVGGSDLFKNTGGLPQMALNVGRAQFRHCNSPHFLSILHYNTYARARARDILRFCPFFKIMYLNLNFYTGLSGKVDDMLPFFARFLQKARRATKGTCYIGDHRVRMLQHPIIPP